MVALVSQKAKQTAQSGKRQSWGTAAAAAVACEATAAAGAERESGRRAGAAAAPSPAAPLCRLHGTRGEALAGRARAIAAAALRPPARDASIIIPQWQEWGLQLLSWRKGNKPIEWRRRLEKHQERKPSRGALERQEGSVFAKRGSVCAVDAKR